MLMTTQGVAAMYSMTISLTILNCIVVPLRFYRRKRQKQILMIDDWLTVPAAFLNIGMSIAMWIGISRHAVGYPTPPMTGTTQTQGITGRTPLDQANDIINMNNEVYFIVSSMFAASLSLSKSSILYFYRRLFCPDGLWVDFTTIITLFMLVIMAVFGIGITFTAIFACGTHFSYYWSSAGAEVREHCLDTQSLLYAISVSDFIIDVIIILIPVPPVWGMRMSLKQKLEVIAVFLTGSVAVVASMIKMIWFLWENQTPWDPSFDQDEIVSTFIFWTVTETHVALLAACLPTLRQCFSGHSLNSVWHTIRDLVSLSSLSRVKSSSAN